MINKIINIVVILLFVASIGLNVFFLLGKGINIDKRTIVHNHQEQFQGQLMINQYYHKGNKIEWKVKELSGGANDLILKTISFLQTLHPTSSYFAKIVRVNHVRWYVLYPDLMELKK